MSEANFERWGEEWKQNIMKMKKSDIIDLFRKNQTGTSDVKLSQIQSIVDAQRNVEGIINDFEGGIIEKDKVMSLLGEYTQRMFHLIYHHIIEDQQKQHKQVVK